MLEFSYEATVEFRAAGRCPLGSAARLGRLSRLHRTERPGSASKGKVRRPIYASSMGKWRMFERQLEPLRAAIEKVTDGATA
jgi:hypothetical protein